MAGHHAHSVHPRHQAQRRRACEDEPALGDSGRVGVRRSAMGRAQRAPSRARLSRSKPRIPHVPDDGRSVAGRRGAAGCVPPESSPRSEGPHLMDQPGSGVRRRADSIRGQRDGRRRIQERPRVIHRPPPTGGPWSGRVARPDHAAAYLSGRARPVPGLRSVEPQLGRPG